MSRPDPTHLELLRLARLLMVDHDRLEPLAALPVADLRALRDQIAGRLFDAGQEGFRRAAHVGNLVPAPLAAKLAQHALGPLLAARTTAVTDRDVAVDLAGRFPADFMADVAALIDPRVVDDLVEHLPPRVIAAVGDELASRQEWLVMADFLGTISTPALQATLDAVSTEAILHVAQLLEDPSRLDEVVSLLSDERLADVVATADELGLQGLLDDLADAVSDEQRARIPTP